jgi:hypothetical protein
MAHWEKGTSGNPHGRPRGSRNKSTAEIKDILAANVSFEALVQKLYAMALKGNVKAAELLLGYGYGRPKGSEELRIEGLLDRPEFARRAEQTLAELGCNRERITLGN